MINVFDADAGTTTPYAFEHSPVRIGRNPLNDLTLPFQFVSGWHAVVRFDGGTVKFFDLGSTNGTLYNGRRVQVGEGLPIEGELAVTIGKLELRISQRQGRDRSAPPPAVVAVPPDRVRAAPGAFGPTLEISAMPPLLQPPPVAPLAPVGPIGAPPQPIPGYPPRPVQAPAPGPSKPGFSGTAHVEMGDVHQLVNRLRPIHQNFRTGWQTLLGELNQALSVMPPPMRSFAVSILQREFPELSREPDFASMAASLGVADDVTPAARTGAGGGDVATVARLAASLRPEEPTPANADEARKFLSCVEDVLRASAKAFVELQKGQEQFGNEMGVRVIKEFTALHAAGTAENVLKYLLDWQKGGPHRTQELVGVYADLMIHQVALINGVMEGVRSLLARLAPEEIERGVTAGWPTRAAAVWKRYTERHREFAGDDRNLTHTVFGAEFARAYAEVGGEGPRKG